VEMVKVPAHLEDSNGATREETVGATHDRSRDRRRLQPKKRIQGDGGSQQKLAAARRRMTRRAVSTWRKGRSHKESTVEKRRRKGPECNSRIKDRGPRRKLRLRKDRTSGRNFRKTVELEIERRTVGSSPGLREV
jgi:hypothetical protein